MTNEHHPFEALEERLQARKTEYDAMSVPDAAASRAVRAGIEQASRKRKSRLRWLTSSISVPPSFCYLLAVFACLLHLRPLWSTAWHGRCRQSDPAG